MRARYGFQFKDLFQCHQYTKLWQGTVFFEQKQRNFNRKQPVLKSQFFDSKLQKQLQGVIQINLNQFANFGPLLLIVCVAVSHNVAFSSNNHLKWHEMQQIETNT